MPLTVTYNGTRSDAEAVARHLIAALTGTASDPWGVVRDIQLSMGVALLSQIQQAFIAKSRGGVGSDGIAWKPLKPETIARRRTTRAELKSLGITGKRVRGFLTPSEDKRWRSIFGTRLAGLLVRGMGVVEAKAIAARIAWATLKGEGAKTKLQVLGGRSVEMLRDTGDLLRSLTPGTSDPDQVLEAPPGKIVVGSRKPYAARQHAMRPFWPANGLPPAWAGAVARAGQRGVQAAIARVLGG